MSTIDHKAEALRLMGAKGRSYAEMTVAEIHVTAQLATVHATLYLAEQARIANLLAFTDAVSVGVRAGEKPSELVWQRFESAGKQIIEGLGL